MCEVLIISLTLTSPPKNYQYKIGKRKKECNAKNKSKINDFSLELVGFARVSAPSRRLQLLCALMCPVKTDVSGLSVSPAGREAHM